MTENHEMVTVDEVLDILEVLISYDTVALTPNLDLIEDVKDRLESLGAKEVLTYDYTAED